MSNPHLLLQLNHQTNHSSWTIVEDTVMGGRSDGEFYINKDGVGIFEGHVSLENNGGFAMVKHQMDAVDVSDYSIFKIRLKGDGKRYQFRVKSEAGVYYSYVHYFDTSGEWEKVEINFSALYPTFRGKKLNRPGFPGDQIEEIAFLIGNNKAEDFRLEISQIALH